MTKDIYIIFTIIRKYVYSFLLFEYKKKKDILASNLSHVDYELNEMETKLKD